jgi:hypothetical protein
MPTPTQRWIVAKRGSARQTKPQRAGFRVATVRPARYIPRSRDVRMLGLPAPVRRSLQGLRATAPRAVRHGRMRAPRGGCARGRDLAPRTGPAADGRGSPSYRRASRAARGGRNASPRARRTDRARAHSNPGRARRRSRPSGWRHGRLGVPRRTALEHDCPLRVGAGLAARAGCFRDGSWRGEFAANGAFPSADRAGYRPDPPPGRGGAAPPRRRSQAGRPADPGVAEPEPISARACEHGDRDPAGDLTDDSRRSRDAAFLALAGGEHNRADAEARGEAGARAEARAEASAEAEGAADA